jgi:hypothetical protein
MAMIDQVRLATGPLCDTLAVEADLQDAAAKKRRRDGDAVTGLSVGAGAEGVCAEAADGCGSAGGEGAVQRDAEASRLGKGTLAPVCKTLNLVSHRENLARGDRSFALPMFPIDGRVLRIGREHA